MARKRSPFRNPMTELARNYRHWQKLDTQEKLEHALNRMLSVMKKPPPRDKPDRPSKYAAEFAAMEKMMLKGMNPSKAAFNVSKQDSRRAAALRRAWYRQPK